MTRTSSIHPEDSYDSGFMCDRTSHTRPLCEATLRGHFVTCLRVAKSGQMQQDCIYLEAGLRLISSSFLPSSVFCNKQHLLCKSSLRASLTRSVTLELNSPLCLGRYSEYPTNMKYYKKEDE
jgi:hypothetical protein